MSGTGNFENCNQFLHDFKELDTFFQCEGYLFFRDILDRKTMLEAKTDFVQVLQQQGIVKREGTEPVWTGKGMEHIDDEALYFLDSHKKVWESSRMQALMEKVFNESVFMFKGINIRFSLPSDKKYLTVPHQDHYYIPQTPNFRTIWIPVMDIEQGMGGLELIRASHKLGLLEHIEDKEVESYILKGRNQNGIALDTISENWLTTEYRLGDLLVLHSHTIHRSMPNLSKKVRLSMDNRFQPISEPRISQAEKTILELRQYRKVVAQRAKDEGANLELTERVLLEMMRSGLSADRENIKKIIMKHNVERY